VSPADARLAVERLESVPGPERQPPGVLLPVPALQHLRHRRRQVVVADMLPRHPARHRERGHVPLQQRLLRARRVDPVHPHPGERQPVGKHLAGRLPAVQPDRHRPEIDLGLRPRLFQLRHEPIQAPRPPLPLGLDLRAAAGHVLRHVRVRHVRVVLVAQPHPGPPGGMPLLARRVQVLRQHRVDQRRHRVPRGRRPLRHLPRGRHRRRQRLPHRPPVHPVLPGDRPDPHPLPVILPDRSEQSHPVPSHPPPRERVTAECDHYPRSRTTCPATSPARRRKPAPRRGQIRGELTRPARSPVEPNQRRRWGHFRVTRPGRASGGFRWSGGGVGQGDDGRGDAGGGVLRGGVREG
jgi:hypothetical protein